MEIGQANAAVKKYTAKILEIRELTESTYILRLERTVSDFVPGQYLVLGMPGSREKREYSIYSPKQAPFIEVLIKEVDTGSVSRQLRNNKAGDPVEIEGPFGYFVMNELKIPQNKYLFVATGTGISPFHSLVQSFPNLQYTLLHGVRHTYEGYEKNTYNGHYIQCTSRERTGDFYGRVTDYLRKHPVDPQTLCYLCGNSSMVDEAYRILENQGLPPAHLHAEIYF